MYIVYDKKKSPVLTLRILSRFLTFTLSEHSEKVTLMKLPISDISCFIVLNFAHSLVYISHNLHFIIMLYIIIIC